MAAWCANAAASDRARRYWDVEIIPGRTLADTIVVSQPARHFYMTLLVTFMTFTLGWSLRAVLQLPMLSFPAAVEMFDLLTPEEVDADGALWIDTSFQQGEAGDSGRKLLAAFAWVRAQHQGRHSPLRRSVAASVGTGRRAPGGTRLPLPEMMMKMLAVVMSGLGLQAGWSLDLGIAVMIGLHLYFRPGELLRLQWGQLHSAVIGGKTVVGAMLHPREGLQPSKTGNFDEATLIDLEPLVLIVIAAQRRHRPNEHVVSCPPQEFPKVWDRAVEETGLKKALGIQHLYVLRHSGASAARLSNMRPELEVKMRGRRKGDRLLKRYEKRGRVLEVLSRCTTATRTFAIRCEQVLRRVLAGSSAPPLPRPELRF